MELHERLKYARERIALSPSEVVARTGIDQGAVLEFEAGAREPSLSQLSELARVYYQSVEFFLSEKPMPKEVVLWCKTD